MAEVEASAHIGGICIHLASSPDDTTQMMHVILNRIFQGEWRGRQAGHHEFLVFGDEAWCFIYNLVGFRL